MADTDDSKVVDTEEEVDEEVENPTGQDEPTDTDSDEDDAAGEETDDDADEGDTFKKRFTQFKGETPGDYIPELEKGYENSTKEAQRLLEENKTLKAQLATQATTPPPTDDTQTPVNDPTINLVKSEIEDRWEQEYKEFVELHPEVGTDPTLSQEINDELAIQAAAYTQKTGRVLGMKQGLERVWKVLDKEDNSTDDAVRNAAKNTAATGKTAPGKKTQKAAEFTEEEINLAKEFGLTAKELAEYNK